MHLTGCFSAKLRGRQITLLPYEIEALSIAAAVKHFSPYLIQSSKRACILTDSKPCVQAYEKLCRGQFSATILFTVSQYLASVRHVAGSAILPSDLASRNPPECLDPTCQVCNFLQRMEDTVVRHTSIQEILSGSIRLLFTSRAAWLSVQSECAYLRRTHAHLTQGTHPSKNLTTIRDVKRYLNVATISSDGLLVVKRNEPLAPPQECIIVPRQVLHGLLTPLHIQLSHPTSHQFKMVAHRYLFALDLDKAIDHVTSGCHFCPSIHQSPTMLIKQSASTKPDTIGVHFAADVIKHAKQLILVLRECVTSYTTSLLIDNECHDTLRDALIILCIQMRPLDGPSAIVRTDPAPGLKALVGDAILQSHSITLELGRVKNNRQDPQGGPVSRLTLSIATSTLNSRIRTRGLSAREIWTQPYQFSNCQIPLSDQELITKQHQLRLQNHSHSEKSKAPVAKQGVVLPFVSVT